MDLKLIPQWWGPRFHRTTVDIMHMRVGGKWRFVNRDPEGKEYAFLGEYKEIVPNKRLVYTFEYEAMVGHVPLETVIFEEIDGRTKVTDTIHHPTLEDLEGMLGSGMERGATESLEGFPELLEKEA